MICYKVIVVTVTGCSNTVCSRHSLPSSTIWLPVTIGNLYHWRDVDRCVPRHSNPCGAV